MIICKNLKETEELAKETAGKVKNGGVIYLYGDLGSGKTVFAKGVAKALGVEDFKVKSPTFNYIRNYEGNLHHIDLYRLEEIDELLEMEIEELAVDDKKIIIIEWADKLKTPVSGKGIEINMSYISENERGVEISVMPRL